MKNLRYLKKFRVRLEGYEEGDDYNGAFSFYMGKEKYFVIASNGEGWEHVSVSCQGHTPSWEAMCKIKDYFFNSEEVVMQLHPKKSEYINNHPYCLHLWRPTNQVIPTPPSILVGYKDLNLE